MFYALSDLSLLKIQGKDAEKFLQGQLTCDVSAVTVGHPTMGAHCSPQGKVISLFHLFLYQEAYYLLMQRDMVPITISALKKYSIFFKVTLDDGPPVSAIGAIFDETHPASRWDMASSTADLFAQIPIAATRSIFVCDLQQSAMENTFANEMYALDESTDQWKLLNIAEGIPILYPATTGKFFPHEIHLDQLNAIHFEKGCYIGQEIIARTHYRGKNKNHLYSASVTSKLPPKPGADIFSARQGEIVPCGVIVEAARKEHHHYDILVLTNELDAATQQLYLSRDQTIPILAIRQTCTKTYLTAHPFAKGEKKHAN
jgi:folate-binding protein YgfZ